MTKVLGLEARSYLHENERDHLYVKGSAQEWMVGVLPLNPSKPFFTGRKAQHQDWRKLLVTTDKTLREAIALINVVAMQILLVVDEEGKLLGTITDGDIRRGILRGMSLEDSCESVVFRTPTKFGVGASKTDILLKMRERVLQHIPIVDEAGVLVDLLTLSDLLGTSQMDNAVVIMAGGYGKRLGELTKDCPKPMLNVGGKPILETILLNFIDQGFQRFYFSVNYLSDQIKEHFGNGSTWGVNIEYLEEEKPLGTAGALHLIDMAHKEPMIVMNGDLLTKVNFQHLLQFHKDSKACATMCVREFDFQVPYGVVHVDDHRLVGLVEKPIHKFFVNAGIYVLGADILDRVPRNQFFNMTTLFEQLVEDEMPASTFPIHEYWKDIGQVPDYHSAHSEYEKVFEA